MVWSAESGLWRSKHIKTYPSVPACDLANGSIGRDTDRQLPMQKALAACVGLLHPSEGLRTRAGDWRPIKATALRGIALGLDLDLRSIVNGGAGIVCA